MRRWIVLIVLCVFSLQACWAAGAAYCQHENTPRAAHLGHHAHDHKVERATPDANPDASGALTPDLDCTACHGVAACVSVAVIELAAAPAASAPPRRIASALPTPPPARVERPDWQALA